KLASDWGEGSSFGSGIGAPATNGDATWNYAFYPGVTWTSGGNFFGSASASQFIGGTGLVTFFGLANDVQSWVNSPGTNFGWELLGDESVIEDAKVFSSRNGGSPPMLSVTYTIPTPEPAGTFLLICGAAGLLLRGRSAKS